MSQLGVTAARTAGFIPQVWAQEGLRVLRSRLTLGARVRRDIDFVPRSFGETITVPYPGTFNAPKKSATGTVSTQPSYGGASVSVTLNTHRATDILIQDVARAQGSPMLMENYIRSAIIAIAEAIEQDIIAQAMQLTSSVGSAGTDLTAAIMRSAMRTLNANKIDSEERFFVFSPKDHAAILGDSTLANYFAYAQQSGVRQGDEKAVGPNIYGFTPYMSQLAPATAVQRIVFTGSTAGVFRLGFNGFYTGDITFNSTAATLASNIQTALQALTDPITMTGLASASGSGTGPWTVDVTFSGAALRYPSALSFTVENVSGTALDGTVTVANTGTVTTTNFALHPEAILFAPRMFEDIPNETGVQSVQVMDEESGLSLRLIYTYDIANRSVRIGYDALYGVTRLRDAAGVRVLA
jgi:hypothetical protein